MKIFLMMKKRSKELSLQIHLLKSFEPFLDGTFFFRDSRQNSNF